MRKFALFASACSVLLFSTLSSGQQFDLAAGIGVLETSSPAVGTLNFQPPSEGGDYVNVSADFVGFRHRRLGLNIETAFRIHQANYAGYEMFRPIFTDVNALFQPRLSDKIGLDLFGGVGVASNRFNLTTSCTIPGCINYTSSNHFMEDIGAGVRYYVWRRIFVRPEIHYYHIQNNVEFNSNNVIRVGASVGYTFGPK